MLFRWLLLITCISLPLYGDHSFGGLREERHDLLSEAEFAASKPLCARKYLFEDWNGWRTRLADRGITATSTYVTDILGNPVGGLNQGFAYTGSLGLDFNFDLEKMYGAEGMEFHVAFGWRAGTNLSRIIGNQFPCAQVFGNTTIWLNVLFIQQTLWDDRFHFRAGRLEAGDYFLQNPLYYNYVSNAFCGNPIAVFFNGVFSAYPNTQWAAYADYKITPKILAKVACFNTNPNVNKPVYNGFNFNWRNRYGAQLITEWTYLVNQQPSDQGPPGNYKFGMFYYTGKFDKFLGGTEQGNFGYYLMLDQMVVRIGGKGSDRGLWPFAALLFAPDNRNLFPFFFTAGAVLKGPFQSRCNDEICLGIAYGSYSSDLRQSERQRGIPTQNFEMVLEANYRIHVNQWLFIQPDIQYIKNPRGFKEIKDAIAVGAEVGITL